MGAPIGPADTEELSPAPEDGAGEVGNLAFIGIVHPTMMPR